MSVAPTGNYLVADMRKERVVEMNLDGHILWQHPTPWSMSADGLHNGNVLVAALRDSRVYEVTRDGKHVWEAQPSSVGQPARVRDAFGRVRLGFDRPRPEGFDLNSVANRARDLRDTDAFVRRRAATALAAHGPDAKDAIPALVEALADTD